MKKRISFVSNSSSSSFIIIDKIPKNVNYVQLTDEKVLSKIAKDLEIEKLEGNIYLTQFIADCTDLYEDFHKELGSKLYSYQEGGCGGWPYDEEDYVEIGDEVFLLKEHSEDFKVSREDFLAYFAYLAVKHLGVPSDFEKTLNSISELLQKNYKEEEVKLFSRNTFEKFLTEVLKKTPKQWKNEDFDLKEIITYLKP